MMHLGKCIKKKFGHCCYSFEDNYVYIYNLLILPEYRNKGMARIILQIAIDEIRKTGYIGEIAIVAKSKEKCIDIERLKKFYKSMNLQVFSYYG